MAQYDEYTKRVLVFNQIERVNRVMSGDLEESSEVGMERYLAQILFSIIALESVLTREIEESDYEINGLGDEEELTMDIIASKISTRFKKAVEIAEDNSLFGPGKRHVEEPV